MRRLAGALALLLALAAPAAAAAAEKVPLDTSRTPELVFNDQRFGAPPAPGMVCVHGHCRGALDPEVRPVRIDYSTYERPGDLTRFAGLAIASPRYTCWEGRLFRIIFRVDCAEMEPEDCLEILAAELDARYGLTLIDIHDGSQPLSHVTSSVRRYVTRGGALVQLSLRREGLAWEMPRVEMVDYGTLQRVALASNPEYRVKTLLVPADYAEAR